MGGNIFILVIQIFRIKNKQIKHALHIKWKIVLKVKLTIKLRKSTLVLAVIGNSSFNKTIKIQNRIA